MHQSDVIAPSHVSDPILMRLLYLMPHHEFIVFAYPDLDTAIHASTHEPFRWQCELLLFAIAIGMLLTQHRGFRRRSPGNRIHTAVMGVNGLFSPGIISSSLDYVNTSICWTSCENQSVLPWSPTYAIHGSSCFILMYCIPHLHLDFFPYLHLLIIAACSQETLVFRMRPTNLPGWTCVTISVQAFGKGLRLETGFRSWVNLFLLDIVYLSEAFNYG